MYYVCLSTRAASKGMAVNMAEQPARVSPSLPAPATQPLCPAQSQTKSRISSLSSAIPPSVHRLIKCLQSQKRHLSEKRTNISFLSKKNKTKKKLCPKVENFAV